MLFMMLRVFLTVFGIFAITGLLYFLLHPLVHPIPEAADPEPLPTSLELIKTIRNTIAPHLPPQSQTLLLSILDQAITIFTQIQTEGTDSLQWLDVQSQTHQLMDHYLPQLLATYRTLSLSPTFSPTTSEQPLLRALTSIQTHLTQLQHQITHHYRTQLDNQQIELDQFLQLQPTLTLPPPDLTVFPLPTTQPATVAPASAPQATTEHTAHKRFP